MKAENKAYIITTTQKENQTFPMVNFIGNILDCAFICRFFLFINQHVIMFLIIVITYKRTGNDFIVWNTTIF